MLSGTWKLCSRLTHDSVVSYSPFFLVLLQAIDGVYESSFLTFPLIKQFFALFDVIVFPLIWTSHKESCRRSQKKDYDLLNVLLSSIHVLLFESSFMYLSFGHLRKTFCCKRVVWKTAHFRPAKLEYRAKRMPFYFGEDYFLKTTSNSIKETYQKESD